MSMDAAESLPDLYDSIKKLGLKPSKVAAASVKELFAMSQADLNAFKFKLIKESVEAHIEANPYYRSACEEKAFAPSDLATFDDLTKIPLIPISQYKAADSHRLLSVGLKQIELEMRSTGTSGIPSVSRRCADTIDGAVVGVYAMYREFLKISKGAGLYLCPSTEEIPEMGMIKALNMLAGLLDTHQFMVKGERFIPEEAIDCLTTWSGQFDRHIIGPPFLINRFIRFLKATNQKLSLDKNSLIITLGGWKRFSGEMLSRAEFDQECCEYLGVEKHQIRDIYALVESNVVAIEDEHGVKHVSPFVHFSVRDPKRLDREVPVGETGQLAILDPLSLSTPGFLLTEDLVRLLPEKSPSGRSGQLMQYVMRLPESTEFGCCAVNLDKQLDDAQVTRDTDACPVVA